MYSLFWLIHFSGSISQLISFEWGRLSGSNIIDDLGNNAGIRVAASNNSPPATFETNIFATGKYVYAFGGWRDSGVSTQMWRFQVNDSNWLNIGGSFPVPCCDDVVATANGVFSAMNWPAVLTNVHGVYDHIHKLYYQNYYGDGVWAFDAQLEEWSQFSDWDYKSAPITGTRGVEASTNKPLPRFFHRTAIDFHENKLYIFGGLRFTASPTSNGNDLWRFNCLSLQWAWVSGDPNNTVLVSSWAPDDQELDSNVPSSRDNMAFVYMNKTRSLYVYGGSYSGRFHDDLWRFNLTSGRWALMRGSELGTGNFTRGPRYASSTTYYPGARHSMLFSADQDRGIMYIFGGSEKTSGKSCNDLWSYSLETKEFAWISGLNVCQQNTDEYKLNIGNIGVLSEENMPINAAGNRIHYDQNSGGFYYWNGRMAHTGSNSGALNDLWFARRVQNNTTTASVYETVAPISLTSAMFMATSSTSAATTSLTTILTYPTVTPDITESTSSAVDITSSRLATTASDSSLLLSSTSIITSEQIPVESSTNGPRRELKETSSITTSQLPLILIITGSIVILTAIILFTCIYKCRNKKRKQDVVVTTSYGFFDLNKENSTITSSAMTSTGVFFYSQTQPTATNMTGTLFPSSIGLAVPAYREVHSNSFALLRQLAKGGGGQIYIAQAMAAETSIYGHHLIVKVIGDPQDEITARQMEAVKQEISILQLMSNDRHFPKFIGYCEYPASILMKFYECGSLEAYTRKALGRSHKLSITRDISRALFALHSNHIAHCDLKPANVLLERVENGQLIAILTDFGLSRITSDEILAAKAFNIVNLRGLSWHYAAPEVIMRFRGSNKYYNAFALKSGDIYAFAIIIYELLGGINSLKSW